MELKVILVEPGVINTSFVPNIKFPNRIDRCITMKLCRERKERGIKS